MNLKNYKLIVDKNLSELFEKLKKNIPSPVYDAMEYAVLSDGKRLRPILTLMTASSFNQSNEIFDKVIDFAIAIELIHNYSLIHDDLPCMDNDDYRRGRLTVHKKYGENVALLAGDALLNLAFEIMTENVLKYPENINALNLVAKSAGSQSGMIKGQILDCYSKKADLKELEKINFYKTGKLINCSILSGAMILNASENQIKYLNDYANAIGVAFQIEDDILDIESTTEVLGKAVGSDEKNDKLTYPTLIGIEKSKEILKKYEIKAIKSIKNAEVFGNELIDLAKYLTNRKK